MEKEKVIECVLLIDDDSTTNHVNKRLLMRSGLVNQVEVIDNGRDALEFLKNTANRPPELILLDLQMEGMDGFTFLEAYKELPANRKVKALVALTSSASFYDLTRLKEYTDVKEHLFKPFTQDQLKEVCDKYM